MGTRRIGGSLLGALLTVVAWQLFGVTAFAPRLLLAMVGFGIGHGLVRVLGGAPPAQAPAQATDAANKGGGKAFYLFAGLVLTVTIVAFGLHWIQVRQVEREAREAHEREESLRAGVVPTPSADASPMPSTSTTAATYASFPETLAAIAADPEARATAPAIVFPDGTRSASYAISGCELASLTWDPKKKDAWGFSARCADLAPKDLAPEGGLDAIDSTYFVITSGPLAGVFVDRNILDPTIWTIATVARRMTYDASMFVFCANKRVPGRSFLSPSDFIDRCSTLIEKKLGRKYCKYEPAEGQSGFDCGRTWETRASCGKELFDEDKLVASFICTYDAKTATIALKPKPKP